MLPALKVRGLDVWVPRGSIAYLLTVGFALNGASFTWYGVSAYFPAGTFACLDSALMIIMTGAVSVILSRRCQLYTILAIVSCVTGSVLYAQPEFLLPGKNSNIMMHALCRECADNQLPVAQNRSEEVKFGFKTVSNKSCDDDNGTVPISVGPKDHCIIISRPNVFIC